MKTYFQLLTILIVIPFFTSCSNEEIDQHIDLLGVWEITDEATNSAETYKLVFGTSNTGLIIQESAFGNDEIISSATPFYWELNKETVTLLKDDNSQNTYTISSEGQLILNMSNDLRLDKVSNDYLQYY